MGGSLVDDFPKDFETFVLARTPEEAISSTWDIEEARSIPWPWPILNRDLGELRAGYLILLAAPQKTGKTIFSMNAVSGWCQKGHKVLAVNMEMTEKQLITMLSQIRLGEKSEQITKEKAYSVMEGFRDKLWLLDTTQHTRWDLIIERCEAAVNFLRLDLIVVDNLHWLCRGDDEDRLMGVVTKEFKLLARKLQIPVIMIHHPRKGAQGQNAHWRPMNFYDLRGSGAITQDADQVIVLFRKFWNEDYADRLLVKGEAMRYAPPSETWMGFNGETATVTEEEW